MKNSNKYFLLGCGSLLVLAIVAIVGIGFLFNQKFGTALNAKLAEGREYGKTATKQGCLDKILARAKNPDKDSLSITDLLNDQSFISGCLETSPPEPHFCDGVPGVGSEFAGVFNGLVFEEQVCKDLKYGENNGICNMVFSTKQKFCW
jgi:hypothetical protein